MHNSTQHIDNKMDGHFPYVGRVHSITAEQVNLYNHNKTAMTSLPRKDVFISRTYNDGEPVILRLTNDADMFEHAFIIDRRPYFLESTPDVVLDSLDAATDTTDTAGWAMTEDDKVDSVNQMSTVQGLMQGIAAVLGVQVPKPNPMADVCEFVRNTLDSLKFDEVSLSPLNEESLGRAFIDTLKALLKDPPVGFNDAVFHYIHEYYQLQLKEGVDVAQVEERLQAERDAASAAAAARKEADAHAATTVREVRYNIVLAPTANQARLIADHLSLGGNWVHGTAENIQRTIDQYKEFMRGQEAGQTEVQPFISVYQTRDAGNSLLSAELEAWQAALVELFPYVGFNLTVERDLSSLDKRFHVTNTPAVWLTNGNAITSNEPIKGDALRATEDQAVHTHAVYLQPEDVAFMNDSAERPIIRNIVFAGDFTEAMEYIKVRNLTNADHATPTLIRMLRIGVQRAKDAGYKMLFNVHELGDWHLDVVGEVKDDAHTLVDWLNHAEDQGHISTHTKYERNSKPGLLWSLTSVSINTRDDVVDARSLVDEVLTQHLPIPAPMAPCPWGYGRSPDYTSKDPLLKLEGSTQAIQVSGGGRVTDYKKQVEGGDGGMELYINFGGQTLLRFDQSNSVIAEDVTVNSHVYVYWFEPIARTAHGHTEDQAYQIVVAPSVVDD